MRLLHVVRRRGKGRTRRNQPDADEILYILAGHGEQMVDDGTPFPVAAGQAGFIPTAAVYSTLNTRWEPPSPLALYRPSGAQKALRGVPAFGWGPPGETPGRARAPTRH